MTNSEQSPHYFAAKMSERKFGVFFRLSERESFFQHVTYKTKREAEAVVSLLNREYREEQERVNQ